MVYYHIQLREHSSNLCMVNLPWVKYCYKRLTMGVANSLDTFRQKINDLFCGFEFICPYIDELIYWFLGK